MKFHTTPLTDKRIIAVVGHYGSGKTEFSVSLAFQLAAAGEDNLAVVDLDIANPYFRSRERKEDLEAMGVKVYGNAYDTEITAEFPALTAKVRAPLENPDTRVIMDVGGNDAGARIVTQFKKHLREGEYELYCIVNCNRPDTSTLDGALEHIRSIENEIGMKVTGLISNAHFVLYTTAEDILDGWAFTREVSEASNIPLVAVCAPTRLLKPVEKLKKERGVEFTVQEMGLYMRETWLDKAIS